MLVIAGGILFGFVDRALARSRSASPQLLARLLDFVPESVALGAVMLVSAGGILYLTFQDIAPQAKLANAWGPALGAVAGFAPGLLGQLLLT